MLTILLLSEFTACNMHDNIMAFEDNVRYIQEFPIEYAAENPEKVESGIIGILDFVFVDSMMIVHTMESEEAWKILSLEDLEPMGGFIAEGRGPIEFLSIPWPSQVEFFHDESGSLCCYLDDSRKKRFCKMHVDKSLTDHKLCLEIIKNDLPYPCFRTVYINDSTLFYKTITNDMTSQKRFLLQNGISVEPESFRKLNSAHVDPGKDYNLMSSLINYVREQDLLVESPVKLNYINIYSPDGSYAMSLCLGSQLSDIEKLQHCDPKDMPMTFSGLRTYKDCFAVLYIGETAWTYETGPLNSPHIYVFDYKGNPLADIHIDRQATGFDFDFKNKTLYIYDLATETMWKYDVPGILL